MCFIFMFMHALYICTYLLIYSHAGLLFLSLHMVWKFVTLNENVIVFKVVAWY